MSEFPPMTLAEAKVEATFRIVRGGDTALCVDASTPAVLPALAEYLEVFARWASDEAIDIAGEYVLCADQRGVEAVALPTSLGDKGRAWFLEGFEPYLMAVYRDLITALVAFPTAHEIRQGAEQIFRVVLDERMASTTDLATAQGELFRIVPKSPDAMASVDDTTVRLRLVYRFAGGTMPSLGDVFSLVMEEGDGITVGVGYLRDTPIGDWLNRELAERYRDVVRANRLEFLRSMLRDIDEGRRTATKTLDKIDAALRRFIDE